MLALFLVLTPLSFGASTDVVSLSVAEAQTAGGGQAGAEELAKQNYGCGWDCELGSKIGSWILSIGGLVSGFGGMLLQYSLENFVIKMSATLTEGDMGKLIEDLWKVIRDLSNLVFIFGFIYIGIRTIFEPRSSQVKSFLAQLVIAALLINFSLFFVRVVIDITNLFAFEVSKLMAVDGNTNIAYAFAKEMGLPGLWGEIDADRLASLTTGGSITFFIGGTLFLLIAGFVFMAAAVLLVVRFVALVFIMIFSPFLIIGSVVGQLDSRLSWKLLFNYAIFAPAFLFLIFISYKIMNASPWSEASGAKSLAEAMTSPAESIDTFAIILQFTIGVVFIIASLQLAKKIGIAGGEAALKTGNKIRGMAQGYVGRGVVGAPMRKFDSYLEDRGVSETSNLRQMTRAGARSKFGSNFSAVDIHAAEEKAKGAKKRGAAKNIVGNKSTQIVEGSVPGASSTNVIAAERAILDSSSDQLTKLLSKHKPGSSEYKSIVKNLSASQFNALMNAKPEDFDETQKENLAKERRNAVENTLTQIQGSANRQQLSDAIKKASVAQLEQLGSETLIQNAVGLSSDQMEQIKKSNKFTETEYQRIADEREMGLNRIFASNPAGVLGGKKGKEIAKLPKNILLNINATPFITGDALKSILEEQTLHPQERQQLVNNMLSSQGTITSSASNYLGSPHGQNF